MIRTVNSAFLVMFVVAAIGLMMSSQRAAQASVEGPCPAVADYTTPCPTGTVSVRFVYSGADCAQCDPFWANGSKYYHCALYTRYNKYCVYPDGTEVSVGMYDMQGSESGGASVCYPNLNGTGQAGCLAA